MRKWQMQPMRTWRKSMTTTKATPEQIHETGLAEVKRIRAEMEKTKDQTEFKGSMAGRFFKYLRTDPKFLCEERRMSCWSTHEPRQRQSSPLLVKLFRTFPRLPYGVDCGTAGACDEHAGCVRRAARHRMGLGPGSSI